MQLQASSKEKQTDDNRPFVSTEEKNKRINILLLALDARPGEATGRTDTMILASIDRQENKAYLLSIPRDTRVHISGYGMDKINAAHMYGGVSLTQKTLTELLGIPVDYYIKTDFNGFREIVDTLGGVELLVDKNMYHNEGDPTDYINLKKGSQKLDGKQALQYVRFRSDELGDISRTQRQQKFLQALAKQMLQVNTVWKLPALVPQLAKAVDTNLGISDLVSLATLANDWQGEDIIAHTLPGNFMDLNGISYWYVDPIKARQAATDFMQGIISTEVIDEGTIVLVEKPRSKPAGTEGADQEEVPVSTPIKGEQEAKTPPKPEEKQPQPTPVPPKAPVTPVSPQNPPGVQSGDVDPDKVEPDYPQLPTVPSGVEAPPFQQPTIPEEQQSLVMPQPVDSGKKS
ncbi:MAG: LCP family protein [Heliobacteriaceae bacterium]|nr:LCP family protein [Heliobacteriaceae bacterium]